MKRYPLIPAGLLLGLLALLAPFGLSAGALPEFTVLSVT